MGQFSVTILAVAGSILTGNQQLTIKPDQSDQATQSSTTQFAAFCTTLNAPARENVGVNKESETMNKVTAETQITQLARNPYSLGIVARYISEIKLFAHFEFGPTLSSLMHQINDGTHLIVEGNDRICGYLGWVRTTKDIAEDWLNNHGPLWKVVGGDAIVVTIFHAQDRGDILRMIRAAKKDGARVFCLLEAIL
jgi:hypothetical protein